ncbi:MAG: hypothetical protein H0X04_01835 [Chthoniobacterales bacterium]|nr:hypothetical protein [Chthoniobacterales bacterium]
MSKRLIIISLVLIGIITSGVAFDRQRVRERQRLADAKKLTATVKKPVPLPQMGELLAAGEGQVSGLAKCGFCYWGEGDKKCNTVLETTDAPGIVFLLPNEKRNELETMTGKCAGGVYHVTAHGTVTQYDGHNYMLVDNFTALKTK